MKTEFNIHDILKNSIVWHVLFILIILFSVSSINVLILAVGMLPFLRNAHLSTPVLVYFAVMSFSIATFLSIFHKSTIFRRKKRKQDRIEVQERVDTREVWKRSRLFSKVISIMILVFYLLSVYILLWALGIANRVIFSYDGYLWIAYAVLAFSLATLIAGFHLATLIMRQKRALDHLGKR